MTDDHPSHILVSALDLRLALQMLDLAAARAGRLADYAKALEQELDPTPMGFEDVPSRANYARRTQHITGSDMGNFEVFSFHRLAREHLQEALRHRDAPGARPAVEVPRKLTMEWVVAQDPLIHELLHDVLASNVPWSLCAQERWHGDFGFRDRLGNLVGRDARVDALASSRAYNFVAKYCRGLLVCFVDCRSCNRPGLEAVRVAWRSVEEATGQLRGFTHSLEHSFDQFVEKVGTREVVRLIGVVADAVEDGRVQGDPVAYLGGCVRQVAEKHY